MESSVQQTCCPSKARHEIEIFDGHVCPTLADTIEHRHDDNAVTFVVYRHPKITVVSPGDGTHPRIGLVVPCVVFLLGLVVHFDEGLPLVELSEQIQELRPGERLRRKAPADIHNAAHDWDITRREVHAHLSVCDARQFLLHLIRVPVPHNVVEHHVATDFGMVNRTRELRPCAGGAGEAIYHDEPRTLPTSPEEGRKATH